MNTQQRARTPGTPSHDLQLISLIVARAQAMGITKPEDHQDHMLDLSMCHFRIAPLDLAAMLASGRSEDISHDIHGIANNLDRTNARLLNEFRPRFKRLATPEKDAGHSA